MERAGVDGFSLTTNIDLGVGVHQPLAKARTVRNWTRLPVAVSGGFNTTDLSIINSDDWDILIVGRSGSEAVQPAEAAREIVAMAHRREARHP
jgi:3-keto-L-gulonate-6-phosphate decarboxylase